MATLEGGLERPENRSLEQLRTALVEQALERKASAPEPPAGAEAAELEPLPAPFRHFFSITSDCDNPDDQLERWRRVGETIRLRHGLPIADSIFVDWPIQRGERPSFLKDGASTAAPGLDRDRYVDANFFLLKQFHRGWFDVIHGWLMANSILVPRRLRFGPPPGGERGAARWVDCEANPTLTLGGPEEGAPRSVRLRFYAPPDWLQEWPIRYLYFRYALPIRRSRFVVRGYVDGERVFRVESQRYFEPHHRLRPLPALIDLLPLVGNDPEPRKKIEIVIELRDRGTGGTLVLEDVTLLSETRADVERQMRVLDAFNLNLSVFSSHGVGMVLGARSHFEPESWDARFCSDEPANPHYSKDLTDLAGIEFYNTFSNTWRPEIPTIDSLIRPVVFNDGSVGYDLQRYLYAPLTESGDVDWSVFEVGGKRTNRSAGDYLGHHVRGALERLTAPGSGVLIYTHAGVRCDVLMDEEQRATGEEADPFDSLRGDSLEALGELADRYYNLSGTVDDADRTLVAGTAVLCRLAQIRRHLARHARYDRGSNTVWIETWFDPVTRRPVPSMEKGMSDLRLATFRVRDAASARVLVDGQPVTHLIRSPADGSGRDSVTIADVRTPTVIFDEVDLGEKGSCTADRAAAELTDGDAFRGQHALELRSLGGAGTLVYRPRQPIDFYNNQYLRFAYRKLTAEAALAVRLHLSDGATWGAIAGGEADRLVALPAWPDTDWHDVVVPYWQLVAALPPAERRPPAEELLELSFEIRGGVLIDCLELLRDNDAPAPRDGRHLVGGTVTPADGVATVALEDAEGVHHSRVTPGGHYLFEHRVLRGAVVTLAGERPDGGRVAPLAGPRHEIWTDSLDFDFSV